MGSIQVVHGGDMPAGPLSHTMIRNMTRVEDEVSAAQVRNGPGTTSSWHHHGDRVGYVYVARGNARVEWGVDGDQSADLEAGDFYVISPHTIHREGNPGPGEQELVAFLIGSGPEVANVEEPEHTDVPMWARLSI